VVDQKSVWFDHAPLEALELVPFVQTNGPKTLSLNRDRSRFPKHVEGFSKTAAFFDDVVPFSNSCRRRNRT
jgi:hypothetical protein